MCGRVCVLKLCVCARKWVYVVVSPDMCLGVRVFCLCHRVQVSE
jgi:hypothetical protein